MQDACRGPYSVDSRKLLGWAAQRSAEACRGSVVPIPASIAITAITVIPFLPAKPLARGEKRSVLPCILFPLRKFVFRHLFAEKEPSCDKGNTQKTDPVEPCVHAIPSCCDGGVSLMRRDRPFRSRLPGGPDIGLPAAPASLSERVPVVPQIPLLRNSSTDKAEMFLKDGNRPISLAPFSQPSGSEREKEEEQDGKNGHGIPKRRTGNHHCLTLVCRDNRFQCVPEPVFLDAAFSMHWRGTENERGFLSRSATRIPSRRKGC